MKLWAAMLAAMLLAHGTGEALAAPSPSCNTVAGAADAADLHARGERPAPATDKDKTQTLADAAAAVLLMEGARLVCIAPGDDAATFQGRDQEPRHPPGRRHHGAGGE